MFFFSGFSETAAKSYDTIYPQQKGTHLYSYIVYIPKHMFFQ